MVLQKLLLRGLAVVLTGAVLGIGFQPGVTGPADDTRIQKPYCRLYGVWRSKGPVSDLELHKIAESFSVIEGDATQDEIADVRRYNSNVKFIHYINSSYTSGYIQGEAAALESKHRDAVSMYLAARLGEDIDSETKTFYLSAVDGAIQLLASNIAGDVTRDTQHYVTWIRIGHEFMRIDAFNPKRNEISVTRGFDNTGAVAHHSGDAILAPIYIGASGEAPGRPGSPLGEIRYAYRPDMEYAYRVKAEEVLVFVKQGYDGSKFDIMGLTYYNQGDAFGNPVIPWDFALNVPYTPTTYRETQEMKINFIQNYIYQQTGKYPVIFANGGGNFFQDQGGTMCYMMSTTIKPRPAGTQWENFVSVPHRNRFGTADGWKSTINKLIYSVKHGFEAAPLITFESSVLGVNDPVALQHEKFGYASYLMGYEPAGKTLVSQAVFRDGPHNSKVAELLPWCTYDLGVPSQTYDDAGKYKAKDSSVYQRVYTKGLVLVNPDSVDVPSVVLSRSYYDPDVPKAVTSVAMPAHTGKILLLKPE